MFYTVLWNAYYGATAPPNPAAVPMLLASNTIIAPPLARQGQSNLAMTLVCVGVQLGPGNALPAVTFAGTGVTDVVTGLVHQVTYAIPGNSYPSPSQALTLDVSVDPSAPIGPQAIVITNSGQAPCQQPAPAFIEIVPWRP